MKLFKKLLRLTVLILFLPMSIQAAAPVERIVSLAPSVTEILFAIGAGAKVVAVDSDSDYPPAVKKLPKINAYGSVDIESILALHPDLIVAWQGGNSPVLIQNLRQFGVRVVLVNDLHIADIADTMKQLGVLTGEETSANPAASDFLQRFQALQKQYSHPQKPVRVMIEIADEPLYVATGDSLQTQVVQLCGGVNVFQSLPGVAQNIATENVLKANPEVIVGLSPISLNDWQAWPELAAVKHQHLYVIDGSLLARNGPRILDGAASLCAELKLYYDQI